MDLGANYDIDRAVLSNRTDCYWEQLQGFTLLVSESPITNKDEVLSNGGKFGPLSPWTASMKNYTVAINWRGQYVRIARSKGLALAEVQVFGKFAGSVTASTVAQPRPLAPTPLTWGRPLPGRQR